MNMMMVMVMVMGLTIQCKASFAVILTQHRQLVAISAKPLEQDDAFAVYIL
jgi:hypothetical protein